VKVHVLKYALYRMCRCVCTIHRYTVPVLTCTYLVPTCTAEYRVHYECLTMQIQVRISEVQKQLRELETSLEMDPDQELSDDESRLVEQLEGLKIEFGEMLFDLRHKLHVHVSPESLSDVRLTVVLVVLVELETIFRWTNIQLLELLMFEYKRDCMIRVSVMS